jgi:hypothetical protein
MVLLQAIGAAMFLAAMWSALQFEGDSVWNWTLPEPAQSD